MNFRISLVVALLASCTVSVPPQFSCPTPGQTTGCGTGQICGPDGLCTQLVECKPNVEARCNGVCVDIVTNRENCGACSVNGDHTCGPSQQCVSGKCTAFCAAGQTACQQPGGGFICANLSNDRNNCGTCNNACGQGQLCDGSGHCGVQCADKLTKCTITAGDGCFDLTSDDAHCGACGTICGAGQHCVNSRCAVACPTGQIECPAGSGACVDTSKDRGNCGGCGAAFACQDGFVCSSGSCTLNCQAGLVNCGGNCIDPRTNRIFCGAKVDTATPANTCVGANAGTICATGQVCINHGPGGTGVCELTCPAGETPCGFPAWNASTSYFVGNQATNGGTLYAAATAGVSAASGGPSGTGSSIVDGSVTWKSVSAAPAGASQCISLGSDRNNCGACDDASNTRACAEGQVCRAGACTVSCASGLTNCNGVCVDTRNDPANCGACGTSCTAADAGGTVCSAGVCGVSCPAGQTNCGGTCVNTSIDPNHCGADSTTCAGGRVCTPGQVCQGGGCTLVCPSGSIPCNGKCVDPQTDNGNCGVCGNPCGPGTVCTPDPVPPHNGICSGTCGPGLTTCNPGTSSAYCATTTSDATNCGTCGHVCSTNGNVPAQYPNAIAYCASGGCGATCASGFANCNGSLTDGCETNLNSDPAHCGTCVNACPRGDNAAPACTGGACGSACDVGFADCDGDPATGCEARPAHDAANCGGCGNVCSGATPYCASTCVALAGVTGVQQNLTLAGIGSSGWVQCFSESYAHVGTTLSQIQTACTGTQILVGCAAPGASSLLAAAIGPASVLASAGAGVGASFYVPATGVPAFGFTPANVPPVFSVSSTSHPFDVGGSALDVFAGVSGSERVSWPIAGGIVTAGGRCGDRVGGSATANYQRIVFTK